MPPLRGLAGVCEPGLFSIVPTGLKNIGSMKKKKAKAAPVKVVDERCLISKKKGGGIVKIEVWEDDQVYKMTITIQTGSLTDFFESARQTAREIDRGEKPTRKNRIWVEPEDLIRLLVPQRISLVSYLRGKNRVMFDELAAETSRTAKTLDRDLGILSEYHLVQIFDERILKTERFGKL